MNAIEASLKQQPQSSSTAALLQGFAAAVMAGNIAFELLLLLLQANAGALLQRKGFSELLHALLVLGDQLQQLLLSALQLFELLSRRAIALLLTIEFRLQLLLAFLLLAQALIELQRLSLLRTQ